VSSRAKRGVRTAVSVRDILAELLPLEADDRGVAAVSVVERRGADPISVWTPELERPPRFLIYSITKTFTAVLILRLCEDGRLQLTDPVATWFPEVPESRRMTLPPGRLASWRLTVNRATFVRTIIPDGFHMA